MHRDAGESSHSILIELWGAYGRMGEERVRHRAGGNHTPRGPRGPMHFLGHVDSVSPSTAVARSTRTASTSAGACMGGIRADDCRDACRAVQRVELRALAG
jgi:hypothetical protein